MSALPKHSPREQERYIRSSVIEGADNCLGCMPTMWLCFCRTSKPHCYGAALLRIISLPALSASKPEMTSNSSSSMPFWRKR